MGAAPAEAPPDELEDVYRRCMEPLFELVQTCFPTLRGCEHDLYQTAWASLLDGRPIDDIEQYLEVAVYRAGLKELRRRQRRPIVPLSVAQFRNGSGGRGVWQQGVEALADRTEPLPEEQVESREDARLLAELLDELTPLQRKIVKLCWGCGIPRREAAALLGISERSAKRELLMAARLTARTPSSHAPADGASKSGALSSLTRSGPSARCGQPGCATICGGGTSAVVIRGAELDLPEGALLVAPGGCSTAVQRAAGE
jgi:RNA polymerase sigma factor (sigma-70 family)